MSAVLAGQPILIVEDEPALAALLEIAVREAGGIVIGPAEDIDAALELIANHTIAAAVIDLIVQGDHCDVVAIELARRGIPFAVTTGIGADASHPELRDAVCITKPFDPRYVQTVLAGFLAPKA